MVQYTKYLKILGELFFQKLFKNEISFFNRELNLKNIYKKNIDFKKSKYIN